MNEISEPGVKVVSGEIIQKSASLRQSDVNNSNMNAMYPFIMLKTSDGEVLKINNVVVDAHIEQHLSIDKTVTLYIMQIRHMINFKKMNFALAARSNDGIGVVDLPLRLIVNQFFLSVFVGALAGAFVGFFAAMPLVGLFGFFGLFLTALVALSFPIYFFWWATKFAGARNASLRLHNKLLGGDGSGNTYRGIAVKSI